MMMVPVKGHDWCHRQEVDIEPSDVVKHLELLSGAKRGLLGEILMMVIIS
jgi:hypothetical protein